MSAAGSGDGLRRTVRAFRHRDYRLFFAGQAVSLVGTWMQSVAQAWLVYRLTGSATLLGVVGFAGQFPAFLLAPAGGVVADRGDKRRTLVATQVASMLLALGLAALTLAEIVTVAHVVTFAAALGLVNAFDIPTRQAFVVDMVGREDLLNAIALNSSMFNGARIVGPAVAGVLVARIGEGWCFLVNGVSYLAVIAGLVAMRVRPRPRAGPRSHPLASLVEGVRHVAASRPIRALLALLGLVSLAGMSYAVLMPLFADRVLGGGARTLGLLMGASGVGALLGALSLAARRGVQGLGTWVALAAAGLGLSLVAFSFSRSLALSMALLVPAGYAMMLGMASSNTLIQTMVPDELRGRVMAAYTMVFMGGAPLGALVAGALAERLGAPVTVALGGVTCIAGAAVFRWRLPKLRSEARRLIVAVEAAGGEPAEHATGGAAPEAPREG